jgi:hypothetical protein
MNRVWILLGALTVAQTASAGGLPIGTPGQAFEAPQCEVITLGDDSDKALPSDPRKDPAHIHAVHAKFDDVGIPEGWLPKVKNSDEPEEVHSVRLLVTKAHDRRKDGERQEIRVIVNGEVVATYPVSTGTEGHETPDYQGVSITRLVRCYYSKKYSTEDVTAWMDYAMFIDDARGIALHSTVPSNYSRLGLPASHGCIRMRRSVAARVFALAKAYQSMVKVTVL